LTTKYTTIIRIILAALAVSMLVAEPNMALIKQHQGYAASQTKQQEQSIIQSLRGNFGKRDTTASQQHSDQENHCLRAGHCKNSNLGKQILGNDNSVTGFSDQSKNIQAAVTPTLISILPPTTLEVVKRCTASCPESTFSIQVTGPNNPQPSSFS
jgi:hypothetical protein